jgi:hypothetical protein
MLKDKPRWRADRGARALKIVGEIEASIAALCDEDLLDLHDIFVASPASRLGMLASEEMQRRSLVV